MTAAINYQRLTNYPLTFDSNRNEVRVDIPIHVTNDAVLETDEYFLVVLSYAKEDIHRVTLNPENTTVAIFEINGEGITIQLIYYVAFMLH